MDGVAASQLDWNDQLLEKLAAVCRPGSSASLNPELGDRLRNFVMPLGWQDCATKLLAADQEGQRAVVTLLFARRGALRDALGTAPAQSHRPVPGRAAQ